MKLEIKTIHVIPCPILILNYEIEFLSYQNTFRKDKILSQQLNKRDSGVFVCSYLI